MSLIICRECGKEISDKAQMCIHCGCPIEVSNADAKYYSLYLLDYNVGKKYDKFRPLALNFGLGVLDRYRKSSPSLIGTGLTEETAQWYKAEFEKCTAKVEIRIDENCTEENAKANQYAEDMMNGVVRCPRCKSTSVTTGQRGYSLVWGFLGSNKTVNRCGKCGHSWEP